METKVVLTHRLHLQGSKGPRGTPGQGRSSSCSFETVDSDYTVMLRRPPERRCPQTHCHENMKTFHHLHDYKRIAMRSCSTPFKLNPPSCVRYILIISPLLPQCFCDFHGIFLRTNAIYNTESLAVSNELVFRSKQQARQN